MARFVLEIGTEEIPARFLAREQDDLLRLFEERLAAERLGHGKATAMASPRRLAIVIEDVAEAQPETVEMVTGPPVSAAWDKTGQPSKALLGFARGQGVPLDQVFNTRTGKGEYVAVNKKSGGQNSLGVLARICPEVIAALPFQKRMRWGSGSFAYARPVRWLLALLDDQVVPFSVGGVSSGRATVGHRVHAPGPVDVSSAAAYEKMLLEQAHVVPDAGERRKIIHEQGDQLAAQAGGAVVWDEDLLTEVCGLVEQPQPVLGSFDASYLAIPEEVLLTSMQTHQKSFGVRDAAGNLLSHFLTVLNLRPKDLEQVRAGWEKVLRARLEDARFFWESDCKTPLSDWQEKLEHVVFIGPLGSMAEKSRRLSELSGWLAEKVVPGEQQAARRAGELAKADLVSGMVGEFDTLQGIMGGIYAARAGEGQEVATAIAQQYLPAGPDSPLPSTPLAAVVAIADKADRLAGCFGLDMIPGGASDPNGLRRCALGIIRILHDRGWDIPLRELLGKARDLYGERPWKLDAATASSRLADFMAGRIRSQAINEGYAADVVDAVLAAGSDQIADFYGRLQATENFLRSEDCLPSAQVLKRVDNITKKVRDIPADWQDQLLQEPAEIALSGILRETLPSLDGYLERGEYEVALALLEPLRQPVDQFFEQVMVMAEDPAIRANRLGMLKALAERYSRIARFSQLAI